MGGWPVKHHKNRKKYRTCPRPSVPENWRGTLCAGAQTRTDGLPNTLRIPVSWYCTNGLGQGRSFISFFSLSSKSLVPLTVAQGCY